MNLVEDVVKMLEYCSKAKMLKEEIIRNIENTFIMQDYELKTKEVRSKEPEWHINSRETKKVIYPILIIPENYEKEEESFSLMSEKCSEQIYSLKEKGKDIVITIKELADLEPIKLKAGKCELIAKSVYMANYIKYSVEIEGKSFKLDRKIEIADIWKRILGDKKFTFRDLFDARFVDQLNEKEENKYSEFLNMYSPTDEIPTLQQLTKSGVRSTNFLIQRLKCLYVETTLSEKRDYEEIAVNVTYDEITFIAKLPVNKYKIEVQVYIKVNEKILQKCGNSKIFTFLDVQKELLGEKDTGEDILKKILNL